MRLTAEMMDKPTWDRYLANWTGARFAEALEGLSTPATFLLGARDPIATREHLAQTIASFPSAEVVTLPGAAHYPMVEQPELTVRAVEQALGSSSRSGPASAAPSR